VTTIELERYRRMERLLRKLKALGNRGWIGEGQDIVNDLLAMLDEDADKVEADWQVPFDQFRITEETST